MKTKLFLGILFVAATAVSARAQMCGPGGVIRGYSAYPAPAYVSRSAVYAPAAPLVVAAPPVVYQPRVVYYDGGYGGYGYYPYHYSPPVHLSFGLGYHGGWGGYSRGGHWGGGHFGVGHGGWRH